LYMNSYYSDGDKMKRLPDNLLPSTEKRNAPLKKGIQWRSLIPAYKNMTRFFNT
jgi:hypothetical protein